jgi:hypothetical protein
MVIPTCNPSTQVGVVWGRKIVISKLHSEFEACLSTYSEDTVSKKKRFLKVKEILQIIFNVAISRSSKRAWGILYSDEIKVTITGLEI